MSWLNRSVSRNNSSGNYDVAALKGDIVDKVSAAIMMIDRDFVVTYVNAPTRELLRKNAAAFAAIWPGFDPEQIVGFLAAELSQRLSRGPVRFRVVVQLAADGDPVDDATAVWPEDREVVEFGTLTITERIDELAPENRKAIFDPVPRVDGIESAGDPLADVRSAIYLLSGRRRRAAAAQ